MLRSRRIDELVRPLRNYMRFKRHLGVRVGFDFASMGDASAVAPTDPRVLCNALSRADHCEFLRDPQGQVLEEWHRRRTERDFVVKLNTGVGKTLVGLVICQSSLNAGAGPHSVSPPIPTSPSRRPSRLPTSARTSSPTGSPRDLRGGGHLCAEPPPDHQR
ncbi:hypothetical protein GCM10022206_50370 [Streptomyces chiangmaiensis]